MLTRSGLIQETMGVEVREVVGEEAETLTFG